MPNYRGFSTIDVGIPKSNSLPPGSAGGAGSTVKPIQITDKKAIVKASLANKFIGFAEGITGSSTESYMQQIGDKYANVGNYNSNDVVFVSIGGKRGNEQVRKEQQESYGQGALSRIKELSESMSNFKVASMAVDAVCVGPVSDWRHRPCGGRRKPR